MATYTMHYADHAGTEATSLDNDGETLRTRIRGVSFVGDDFDGLEPEGDRGLAESAGFTLQDGCLCACTLACAIPQTVICDRVVLDGVLHMQLVLGRPRTGPRRGIDQELLTLRLETDQLDVSSSGTTGWFEDELLDLHSKLPEGTWIKACFTCAFSDYSPYGHGLFGCLACFRSNKSGYANIVDKSDLFDIWDTHAGFVQETYLCAEFERRKPGTGYRG